MSKQQKPAIKEVLDEVEARFLYNLPESELNQTDRLFFQIEQAYWYYEDFKADKYSHLPHFASLKTFAEKMFNHSALLSKMGGKFSELFTDFRQYKSGIPVFGCIILNPKMNKVALVCDYNSKSWMFPRGKVNEGESDMSCAIREVFEETGFNAAPYCKEDDHLVVFQDGKKVKLYIASYVPENIPFDIKVRKEISAVQFYPIDALPKSTYGVFPFIPKLKRWVSKHYNKKDANKAIALAAQQQQQIATIAKSPSLTGMSGAGTGTGAGPSRSASASKKDKLLLQQQQAMLMDPRKASPNPIRARNAFDQRNGDTFEDAAGANKKGWDVNAMFKANAKLTGKSYAYDGNPQAFGASHPKYQNFNVDADAAALNSSLDAFEELSAMSLIGHKMLRGEAAPVPTYEEFEHGAMGIAARDGQHTVQVTVTQGEHASLDDLIAAEGASHMLPKSAYVMQQQQQQEEGNNGKYMWSSPKLRSPFVFNKANIMNAIEQSFRQSSAATA